MTPAPNLHELIETIRRDAGSDDPLDQLATASTTVTELNETSDAALGYFVDRARASGKSWVEISQVLGVTKQAVHKRFSQPGFGGNLERFTDRAKTVMQGAPEVAIGVKHPYVGTEHLLLAQFKAAEGIAGQILLGSGITETKVRKAVLARVPAREEEVVETPWTPRAGEALQEALSVALGFGHNYIGTEHLLLGLYKNPESLAAKILDELGLDADTARGKVVEALAGYTKQ